MRRPAVSGSPGWWVMSWTTGLAFSVRVRTTRLTLGVQGNLHHPQRPVPDATPSDSRACPSDSLTIRPSGRVGGMDETTPKAPDNLRSIDLTRIGAERYKATNDRGGVLPIGSG